MLYKVVMGTHTYMTYIYVYTPAAAEHALHSTPVTVMLCKVMGTHTYRQIYVGGREGGREGGRVGGREEGREGGRGTDRERERERKKERARKKERERERHRHKWTQTEPYTGTDTDTDTHLRTTVGKSFKVRAVHLFSFGALCV